ncbi:MAG: DNA repair protein RadA [Hyphomicrobiaceae bacterium]
MARAPKAHYVCQQCGSSHPKWAGKCPDCGAWNALVEDANVAAVPGSGLVSRTRGSVVALETLSGVSADTARIASGSTELDRVTGGGIVPGSAVLIGGEPGIGKSTLLLQVAARVATSGRRAVYFSGEEAVAQVRMRASRLGLAEAPVGLAAETNLSNILATLSSGPAADLVIVDSIQTLWADGVESAPGSVSQVRAATQSLIRFAKAAGCAVVLVGHVTKEGQIAGPKVVEHMVDTVLYFEGDRGRAFRVLRAVKNRFGPADEIGVFEMVPSGLADVANPSGLFLGDRDPDSPGAAVFAGIEGTRPILVEFQALVVPSPLGTPRRAVVGWDSNRLAMVLAILDARCGVSLAQHDVYLNVAGGIRVSEPAADVAAAAALLSALTGEPVDIDQVSFGELALSGSVRAVAHTATRLKEAEKLGFKSAILAAAGDLDTSAHKLRLDRLLHLKTLAEARGACK